jgi:hypothetical protein
MNKTFPEGFYWGEEVLRHFRKTVPDISGAKRTEISTRCTASVRRGNPGPFSQEVASYFGKIATTCTVSVRDSHYAIYE